MNVLVTEGESQIGLGRNEHNLREQKGFTFRQSLGDHWATCRLLSLMTPHNEKIEVLKSSCAHGS